VELGTLSPRKWRRRSYGEVDQAYIIRVCVPKPVQTLSLEFVLVSRYWCFFRGMHVTSEWVLIIREGEEQSNRPHSYSYLDIG